MAGLNEHLLHDVLYPFHLGDALGILFLRQAHHLVRQLFGQRKIRAAHGVGSLEDGQDDFFLFEGDIGAVSFDDQAQHTIVPCFLFCDSPAAGAMPSVLFAYARPHVPPSPFPGGNMPGICTFS
ncbi:hypothetical protein SDC9_207825 [bioreactor metagenome]|uniref:Uncharacterized protein n=1 Tax=bioreactor metagenome TaxID=1076179 RepID=A0A645JAB4_9ZZZZ